MAAQPKYNALYHDDWAWSMATMGATNEEIADAIGVSKRTIIRWAKEHESFGKALAEGKAVSDAKVIRSLYKRATGYDYIEEKKIVEVDKDGTVKPVRVETTKKHVPPDVAAQCFWLKNRQKDNWRDRPDYIETKMLEINQRKEEFEYKKEKDAGIAQEIEDMDQIEGEVYGGAAQIESNQKNTAIRSKNEKDDTV